MIDGRILLVDDDRDLRSAVAEALEDEGYQVDQAENGRSALDVLRTERLPDLVLLDLMMPVMNGQEFRVEQLRDPAIAHVPVALMTAGAVGAQLGTLAPAAVIRKPVAVDDLLEIVADLVRDAVHRGGGYDVSSPISPRR